MRFPIIWRTSTYRLYICFLGFLLVAASLPATNEHESSFQRDLKSRLDLLIAESRQAYQTDLDLAREKSQLAFELASENQIHHQAGEAAFFLSVTYNIQGNYPVAMGYLDSSLSYSRLSENIDLEARIWRNKGIVAYRQGKNDDAIELYQKALAIHHKEVDSLGVAKVYTNLGNVYNDRGEFSHASFYYKRAVFIKDSLVKAEVIDSARANLAPSLLNLGIISHHQDEYLETMRYWVRVKEIFEAQDNRVGMASIYANLGALFQEVQEYDLAIQYYHLSQDLQLELELKEAYARLLSNIASVYHETQQLDSGLLLVDKSIDQLRALKDTLGLANSLAIKADLLFSMGEIIEAEKLAKRALQIGVVKEYWEPRAKAYFTLFEISVKSKNLNHAKEYANKLLGDEEFSHLLSNKIEVLSWLANVAKNSDEPGEALDYYLKFMDTFEAMKREEKRKTLAALEARRFYHESLEVAQMKASQAQSKANQMSFQRDLWFYACCAFFCLGTLAFVGYKFLRDSHQQLDDQHQQLRELAEEKNQLLGVMTHDLRTPVTQISALNHQLKEELREADESDLAHLLSETIEKATQRLGYTIQRILDLSSAENRASDYRPRICNPLFTLNEVAQQFSFNFTQKNLAFRLLGEQNLRVWLDQKLFKEIIENLVSNAMKFSQPGSIIEAGAVDFGERIRIFVKDEGPGVLPEEMDKLFGKFQKLSARPTAGEPSTGLGLAIVKEYTELMGGKIWCESTYGEGATFWLEFPTSSLG